MTTLFFKLLLIPMLAYTSMAQPIEIPGNEIELTESNIEFYVYLEGAFDSEEGVMKNKLNELGYLPGMKPKTFFSRKTESGQPYKNYPWEYQGNEGVVKTNDYYNYDKKVVDWVLVSIREKEHYNSTVFRAPAHVYVDGRVKIASVGAKCSLDPSKRYYIVIEHRNHLAVMSKEPVAVKDGNISYDFRYTESYQEGHKQIGDGMYAMIAGNANPKDTELTVASIDEDDIKSWEGGNGLNSSYFLQDVDLSGDVSVKDKEILFNNMGLISMVPQ
jgi:hypothetical protein